MIDLYIKNKEERKLMLTLISTIIITNMFIQQTFEGNNFIED